MPRPLPWIAALLLFAANASAESISLTPRFAPGDSFQLSLRTETSTEAVARGRGRTAFDESVQLDYAATVSVLEVDERGAPVRERHRDVQLTFARPDESGSLFSKSTAFDVHRADGEIRIFIGEQRAPAGVERVVAKLLQERFDRAAFSRWLEPDRPVVVGETWQLDPHGARRLLALQGIHVHGFDGPPTATLERRGEGLAIRYRIPVRRVGLTDMPANTETARSRSQFEGHVDVPVDPRAMPISHSARFAIDVQGAVRNSRVAPSHGWRLERTHTIDQRLQVIERVADAG